MRRPKRRGRGSREDAPLARLLQSSWVPGLLVLLATAGAHRGARAVAGDPLITEILALNQDGLRDEDGDTSDWVEIHNPGPDAADLTGWYLTDDAAELTKWRFPAVTLEAGGYLLVFASGKDRSEPGRELHASFRLDAEGDFLALVRPDGMTVVDGFAPRFPEQRDDVSFGVGVETIAPPLLAVGTVGRALVPSNGELGLSWTGSPQSEPFDDSASAGWIAGPTGFGFDLASDDVPPVLYLDCDDASDPRAAVDSSGRGNDGSLTSQLELTGVGGGSLPVYTPSGGGHTGAAGDRALDFGLRGNGACVAIAGAATGAFDGATAEDAITVSLWLFGGADQPASDVVFWGSSSADGTGTRSLNAHVPWSDSVVYWDTAGCCNESQRVFKPEPDSTRWKGQWNHWVFVKEGDSKRVYQNGELFLEGTNNADLTPIRGFFIGAAPRNGDMSYGGLIDDVAVWDRALSDAQVAALAHGASPLALSSFAGLIATDMADAMLGRNASVYLRVPFEAPESVDADALLLRLHYEDGFVAYLNGLEVARRNASGVLGFDSAATASRSREAALLRDEIDLSAHLGWLRPGRNVLAFHGLNEGSDSADFLLLPELVLARSTPAVYLRPPTPGRPNAGGSLGFVDPVRFLPERGFFDSAFNVELSCATEGAAIWLTTDGSDPDPDNPAARPYAGPVAVAGSSILRAAAYREGFEPSPSVTHSYLFPADAARQPARPAGLPASWSGGFPADYEVDPDVVSGALPGYGFEDALLSIPTISIAMPRVDLWDPTRGIYSNSSQVSERPASVELLHPDGTRGFQANAGVRVHGNTSRQHGFTPKHSFRVLFKGEYGPRKLEYPLFPDSDVRRLDQFVLRGMSTDSWPVMDGWSGPEPGARRWYREKSLYLRERWMKDSQLDMGQLACHGLYVHLFLDGLYWGVYSLTERPTDSFLAEHLGGDREEFDVLRDFAEIHSGDKTAWSELMALASSGLSSAAAYERIQGNLPDGTRNPAYPRYLDVDDLIDYMILHIYASADDWPNHNWWAGRRRGEESEGFRFFAWDQEITLMDLAYEHTSWGPRYEEVSVYDTPAYLYAQLRANPEFRVRFGDRVQRHLFGQGPLTPQGSSARLFRRAGEVDKAMVAESARWGDSKRANPLRREVEWLTELGRLRDEHFPALHSIALDRFRRVGLYPSIPAPTLTRYGGRIPPGFELWADASLGTVWYTMDGEDPRAPSGEVSPTARASGRGPDAEPIVLPGTITVKARTLARPAWSALVEASFEVDIPLRVTEIHYHPADPPVDAGYDDEDLEFIEIQNVGATTQDLLGVRLRGAVRFVFDDGAVASLGPGELVVVVRDLEAFGAEYRPTQGGQQVLVAGEFEGELHNAGERILLEGPEGESILDFRYLDVWYPETDGGGRSLVIRDPRVDPEAWGERASWRPSDVEGGTPGIDDSPLSGGLRAPGDFNQDGTLDISDPVSLLTYLFVDGSAPLPCEGSGDAVGIADGGNGLLLDSNGDRRVDLSDAIHTLSFLFVGGPAHVLGTSCVAIPGCTSACSP